MEATNKNDKAEIQIENGKIKRLKKQSKERMKKLNEERLKKEKG